MQFDMIFVVPFHRRTGVGRCPPAWGALLLAGCMGVSPRPSTVLRPSEPDAPLGAQGPVETRRVPMLPKKSAPEIAGISPAPLTPLPKTEPAQPPLRPPQLPRLEPPEPPLRRPVELEVAAAPRQQLGTNATYRVVVRNTSNESIDEVLVRCQFDPPLAFPGSTMREVLRRLDNLSPGESRELPLSLVSTEPGRHCCRFVVLQHEDVRQVELASQQVCIEFVSRQLDMELVGPTRRTEGSRAEFTAILSNRSPQALNDVQATLSFDRALAPREASRGYQRKPAALVWNLGTIEPLESVHVQVDLDCRSTAHRACVMLEVQAAEFAAEHEEACLEIVAVPGTLDLRISDRDDPLDVGKAGQYEATVHNLGLQPARNVVLTATIPEHLRVLGANVSLGPETLPAQFTLEGGRLTFDTIATLAADATLVYTIDVEALRSGKTEIQASLTSSLSQKPVVASEPTLLQEP